MRRRHTLPLLIGSALMLLVAGCGSDGGSGSADAQAEAPGMTMHSEMHMSHGMHAAADRAQSKAPSETASMVCGDEIRGDVASIFALSNPTSGTSTWQGGLFTCTYRLPGGPLTLSVKDSLVGPGGRAYFNALRAFDGGPALLKGLEAFGLPSYETSDGRVVFLKDGKTLAVDAGALPESAGPNGESRTDVAYAVAADVIGCWSE